MKILGYIFGFLINPFSIILNIDIKNKEKSKYKWLEIVIWLLLSIIISAVVVYLVRKCLR